MPTAVFRSLACLGAFGSCALVGCQHPPASRDGASVSPHPPWGNDPVPADATSRTFCAERADEPASRYTSGRPDWMCYPVLNTADQSPFGVLGMGSNGREMNATCVRPENAPKISSCLVRYADVVNDEMQQSTFPGLAASVGYVDDTGTLGSRVDETTSFRCATSERFAH